MWYWLFKYVFMGPLLVGDRLKSRRTRTHSSSDGPAILASNHLAVADSFYLPLVVPRRITFLAKAEYFTGEGLKGRFIAWFYTVAGQVPIDTTDAYSAKAALDTWARTSIRAGCSACIRRAPARRTAACTRARPGWRVWRWQSGVPVIPASRNPAPSGGPRPGRRCGAGAGKRCVSGSRCTSPGSTAGLGMFYSAAGGHRRGDLRTDAAVRSGIRRHLRGQPQRGCIAGFGVCRGPAAGPGTADGGGRSPSSSSRA